MKIGDITVCSTNELYGLVQNDIKVGKKYQITNLFDMYEKTIFQIIDESGTYGLFDSRHFIPVEVWREFQIRKVLD